MSHDEDCESAQERRYIMRKIYLGLKLGIFRVILPIPISARKSTKKHKKDYKKQSNIVQ